MEIIIIAAMSENHVIGKNNSLPWKLKADMKHFRELTMGWPCIMGRKTWESLPVRPLPGRLNIIISKSLNPNSVPEAKVFSSLQEAIKHCENFQKIFICGGESIYRDTMALANSIELTLIHKQYEGDACFPEIDPVIWKIASTSDFGEFSFIRYVRLLQN